ncbi:MAG TPA: hypothetical protein VHP35_00235, partial [Terriglobia bacterium]|nr:hypothetical protein [Terriglobia bacterium]
KSNLGLKSAHVVHAWVIRRCMISTIKEDAKMGGGFRYVGNPVFHMVLICVVLTLMGVLKTQTEALNEQDDYENVQVVAYLGNATPLNSPGRNGSPVFIREDSVPSQALHVDPSYEWHVWFRK